MNSFDRIVPTQAELESAWRDLGDIRVAFLYARPGHESIEPLDRRWAASLASMARQAGIACDPVHLANDVRILPIPLDELDAA